MTSATSVKKKAGAKAGYYLADGTRVPSVTTILGVINKPALVKWANNLGLQGIDSTKYVDALADIGTMAHDMILADLRGESPADVTAGQDKAHVDLAENCFISYLTWRKGKDIKPVMVEAELVSEAFRFGGRCDFYGDVDGVRCLIDFKTGNGIWPEHFYQLAAYAHMIVEAGEKAPDQCVVLNIPRANSESFDSKARTDVEREWELFLHALSIYRIKQELERR